MTSTVISEKTTTRLTNVPTNVRRVRHWQTNGFGWRVAVSKESSEPVGFAALNHSGDGTAGLDPDEFEVGWWLDPSV